MSPLILYLRSLLFYLGYLFTLAIHCCISLLFGFFLPVKHRFKLVLLWNNFVIWWLKVCCGVHYKLIGKHHIPQSPFILLSNHQSPWETIFLYACFSPITAILKKQLLYIPFFGWALYLLKPIAIDRKKTRQARSTILLQGQDRIKNNISVLIFPEGTRVNPGDTKKFSTGGASLAIECNATVLPVAHNAGTCWPAHKFIKYPGTINVNIGEPFNAKGFTARELTEKVETWIKSVN